MSSSPFIPNVLKNKVALVTGGSSGIGYEIARQLGLHGCKVAISGRREAVLKSAAATLSAEGIEVLPLQGDVRSDASCQKWIQDISQKWGPQIHVLVNCAAGNFLVRSEALSSNGFKTVMDIDVVGTFNVTRAAFPLLKAAASRGECAGGTCSATGDGDALVINISATLQYGATWWQAHASAAKSAIDSLTRSLALEWGEYGIRVNAIAPGPIKGTAGVAKLLPQSSPTGAGEPSGRLKSDGVDNKAHDGSNNNSSNNANANNREDNRSPPSMYVPLRGKMGATWDIAMSAVYLATPAARFMSGATMVVDGAAWIYRAPAVSRETVDRISRAVEGGSRGAGHAAGQTRSKL